MACLVFEKFDRKFPTFKCWSFSTVSVERKNVEMLFAHLKRILKWDRLKLRGITGAHEEFLLAATAQNLRRMLKFLSQPPPDYRGTAPV